MTTRLRHLIGVVVILLLITLSFHVGLQAVRANPGNCISCNCNETLAWINVVTLNYNGMKTHSDTPAQLMHCFSSIEAAACSPGTCQSNGTADLWQYNNGSPACLNPHPGWTWRGASVSDSGWRIMEDRPWQKCKE